LGGHRASCGSATELYWPQGKGIVQTKETVRALLDWQVAVVLARYTVHAGALNPIDSAAYGTLLIAEAAIDQVRTENQTGPLPAEATLSSLYI